MASQGESSFFSTDFIPLSAICQSEGTDGNFRRIVEALPAATYVTDADGTILFFNEAAAALWGRRPQIGVERWCGSYRLYWPDGRPMAHDECPMARAIKSGIAMAGLEAIAERPDGSRYFFLAHPSLLLDSNGHVAGAVNLLVDITAHKRNEEAAYHLTAIVQNSIDAIVSKDLNGTIKSWNKGAELIFGYSAQEAVGRPIYMILPEDRYGEETGILSRIRSGERIEHFETVRRHKDGHLLDVSLTISPVKDAKGNVIGASKIARDITERKKFEKLLLQQTQRLAMLNRVSRVIFRDLDLERIVQAVTDLATELSGAQYGAFFYRAADKRGESYQLYALSGARKEDFAGFGLPRNTSLFESTFRDKDIVRSGDIRKDPRYGRAVPDDDMPADHLPVVSYLAVPVISASGTVLGGLFFGHPQTDIFDEETEALIEGIAAQAGVAIDNARLHEASQTEIAHRRRAEEAKEFLIHEIKHRVKNTLGTVQAIASQTLRHTPQEERDAFVARLHALSRANDILTRENWEPVSLQAIISQALAVFEQEGRSRFTIEGADLRVGANKALLIALTMHELGTNALKYGALSKESGRVAITWSHIADSTHGRLALTWREQGGPTVSPPTRAGFGSRMIARALRGESGAADFDFAPEGMICRMELAL